jgi:hypothetical protein
MNKLKPIPKHPSSLRGGINTRRREKVTLLLLKVVYNSCMFSCMFLFSSSFPMET